MSRNVSATFQSAVNAASVDTAFIVLVTVSHSSFTDDIRVASDPYEDLPTAGVRGVISNGDEYLHCPFTIELPAQDDSGVARARISIDNVDRTVVAAARSADSPVSIKIQIVLSSAPDTVEVLVDGFRLEAVEYDALTVSGEISVEYFDLEPFPKGRFNPSEWSGLH